MSGLSTVRQRGGWKCDVHTGQHAGARACKQRQGGGWVRAAADGRCWQPWQDVLHDSSRSNFAQGQPLQRCFTQPLLHNSPVCWYSPLSSPYCTTDRSAAACTCLHPRLRLCLCLRSSEASAAAPASSASAPRRSCAAAAAAVAAARRRLARPASPLPPLVAVSPSAASAASAAAGSSSGCVIQVTA